MVEDIFKRQLQDLGNKSVIQPIKAALYFEKCRGIWRMADLAIHRGAKVPTRSPT
jgi:hypothetical protein